MQLHVTTVLLHRAAHARREPARQLRRGNANDAAGKRYRPKARPGSPGPAESGAGFPIVRRDWGRTAKLGWRHRERLISRRPAAARTDAARQILPPGNTP